MRIEGGISISFHQTTERVQEGSFPKGRRENGQGLETYFSEHELIRGIETTNERLEIYNSRLEFSIHEKTKDIMIKVINTQTDEVIREIPPQKILDMVANMLEQAGLLVDEKV